MGKLAGPLHYQRTQWSSSQPKNHSDQGQESACDQGDGESCGICHIHPSQNLFRFNAPDFSRLRIHPVCFFVSFETLAWGLERIRMSVRLVYTIHCGAGLDASVSVLQSVCYYSESYSDTRSPTDGGRHPLSFQKRLKKRKKMNFCKQKIDFKGTLEHFGMLFKHSVIWKVECEQFLHCRTGKIQKYPVSVILQK